MAGIVAHSPGFRLARNAAAQQAGDLVVPEPEAGQDLPALAAEGRGGRGGRKSIAAQPQRWREHSYGPDGRMRQVVDESVGHRLRIVKNFDGELHAGRRNSSRIEDRLPLGGGTRGQDVFGLPAQRRVVPVGRLAVRQRSALG